MNNGYQLLTFYKQEIEKNSAILRKISSLSKDEFSSNEELIALSVSLLKLSDDIYLNVDKDIFMLSKELFDLFRPLHEYSQKYIYKNGLLNAYKLYDFICVDLKNIYSFLDKVLGEK